jgi:hypothetical protein
MFVCVYRCDSREKKEEEEERRKERKGKRVSMIPGHIGLSSENHPGMTVEMLARPVPGLKSCILATLFA